MIKLRALLLAAAIVLPSAPAAALDSTASILAESQQNAYRLIFAAIREGRWTEAAEWIDAMDEGPLHNVARAELYLAPNSPKVELAPLLELLQKAPELPHAAQIARLAIVRGATERPPIVQTRELSWVPGQPRRRRAPSVKNDPAASELDLLIQPLIKENQPHAAEALLLDREYLLTPEARTEFQQRIAWSHYITGNDAAARQVAQKARAGSGEWAIQADWIAGLASWRMGDCNTAAAYLGAVASRTSDPELNAAANYWTSRSDMKCGRPERVQARLKAAARHKETFYGLLAQSALGMKPTVAGELHDYRDSEWRSIAHKPNVRAAIALNAIGERNLADKVITHQARIGDANDHYALLHLAAELNLAGTQVWLAHNAPRGARVNMAARYPRPSWQPTRGWRVDQSLAYAHALQESNFRSQAVSSAGAVGLMQVRPGSAGDIARKRGEYFDPAQLAEPSHNLEYGQSYLEFLRDYSGTGGLLPKVIAAYNAGPAPIAEWNTRGFDRGDPLLYIESLPYWETRGYVPIVMRNYWIYEQKAGREGASRKALAQGLWPRFPGLPGVAAVRIAPPTYSRAASSYGAD